MGFFGLGAQGGRSKTRAGVRRFFSGVFLCHTRRVIFATPKDTPRSLSANDNAACVKGGYVQCNSIVQCPSSREWLVFFGLKQGLCSMYVYSVLSRVWTPLVTFVMQLLQTSRWFRRRRAVGFDRAFGAVESNCPSSSKSSRSLQSFLTKVTRVSTLSIRQSIIAFYSVLLIMNDLFLLCFWKQLHWNRQAGRWGTEWKFKLVSSSELEAEGRMYKRIERAPRWCKIMNQHSNTSREWCRLDEGSGALRGDEGRCAEATGIGHQIYRPPCVFRGGGGGAEGSESLTLRLEFAWHPPPPPLEPGGGGKIRGRGEEEVDRCAFFMHHWCCWTLLYNIFRDAPGTLGCGDFLVRSKWPRPKRPRGQSCL